MQAHVFQNSRCASTGLPLELPAVHFMCGHSFNRSALGDNERECPLHAEEFRQIADVRRSLLAGASEQVLTVTRCLQDAAMSHFGSAWALELCVLDGSWPPAGLMSCGHAPA